MTKHLILSFLICVLLLNSALCPLPPEIAEKFLSPKQVKDYRRLLDMPFDQLVERSKRYADDLFGYKLAHNEDNMTKSFLLHNAKHYADCIKTNSPNKDKISVDLHGVVFQYGKHFVRKGLCTVERLRTEHIGKPDYEKYAKIMLITGHGKHTIGGAGQDTNRNLLERFLIQRNYQIEIDKRNPGVIYVVLDSNPSKHLVAQLASGIGSTLVAQHQAINRDTRIQQETNVAVSATTQEGFRRLNEPLQRSISVPTTFLTKMSRDAETKTIRPSEQFVESAEPAIHPDESGYWEDFDISLLEGDEDNFIPVKTKKRN